MGLETHLERLEGTKKERTKALSLVARSLSWPDKSIEQGTLPSMRVVAKATKSLRLYQFLYHATSRFVHFSGAELARRAWGEPGNVQIHSGHFHDYWGAFSLYWGLRIFVETTVQCPAFDYSAIPNGDTLLQAIDGLMQGRVIPIVTAEELKWPSSG